MRSMIEAVWRKALVEAYPIAPIPSSQRGLSAAFRSFAGNEPVLHWICGSSGRPHRSAAPVIPEREAQVPNW